jgi:hypothetical protein
LYFSFTFLLYTKFGQKSNFFIVGIGFEFRGRWVEKLVSWDFVTRAGVWGGLELVKIVKHTGRYGNIYKNALLLLCNMYKIKKIEKKYKKPIDR